MCLPVLALVRCAEKNEAPAPEAPGSFLLDQPWEYQSTNFVTSGEAFSPSHLGWGQPRRVRSVAHNGPSAIVTTRSATFALGAWRSRRRR